MTEFDLFPQKIQEYYQDELTRYLDSDLTNKAISIRIEEYFDNKNIPYHYKKILITSAKEIAYSMLSRKIPPFLLETNLKNLKFIDNRFNVITYIKNYFKESYVPCSYNSSTNELKMIYSGFETLDDDLVKITFKHEMNHVASSSIIDETSSGLMLDPSKHLCSLVGLNEGITEDLTAKPNSDIYFLYHLYYRFISALLNDDLVTEYYTSNAEKTYYEKIKRIFDLKGLKAIEETLKTYKRVNMEKFIKIVNFVSSIIYGCLEKDFECANQIDNDAPKRVKSVAEEFLVSVPEISNAKNFTRILDIKNK